MQLDDLILVSVDDHVVEPPDLFDNHLPKKWLDRAPKVVHKDDGTDVWVYEGAEIPNIGLNAVAGRPKDEYGVEPTSFDEIRRGCYDIHERVRDMNANGVLGSMCFPSFTGFAGKLFAGSADKSLAHKLVMAYNDWHIDEWCGSYPGRFIPMVLPPIWDAELMAAEVRRVAKKGCHSLTFSENPEKTGFPSLHNDHWDPFWKACADEGTVVCMHIGSSSQIVVTSVEAPIDVMITLQPMNIVQAAADLLWSPVLRKYPTLKFALSEGGIGWVPYFLDRVDRTYEMHRAWTNQNFGDKRPSDVFREHLITCFIDDPIGIEIRHHIGVDGITWECDYPHSDSTWPHSPESVMKHLAGVPDDEINKITHENAMREFQFDPFSLRSRESCTVGALRTEATDVDVEPRRGNRRPQRHEGAVSIHAIQVTS
ncbi:MAG: amidohydrolase family protein [Acidimicrobiales bacterium]